MEAHPLARPINVIQELAITKSLLADIKPYPANAVAWEDVDYLEFQSPMKVPPGTYDLREYDAWERYQEPRIVMVRGPMDDTLMRVAVSRELPVDMVYDRINQHLKNTWPWRQLEHIEVYDHSLWTAYASPTYQGEQEESEEENYMSPEVEETFAADETYVYNDHYVIDGNYGTDQYVPEETYVHKGAKKKGKRSLGSKSSKEGRTWRREPWHCQPSHEDSMDTDPTYCVNSFATAQVETETNDQDFEDEHYETGQPGVDSMAERVKEVIKQKRTQCLRGGMKNAASQTEFTVGPRAPTPAINPQILLEPKEYEDVESTQIVVVEVPATTKRTIMTQVPLTYTVDDCLQKVARELRVLVDQCVLQSAGPASEVIPECGEAPVPIPPTSASSMRMIMVSWSTCPDRQTTYYPRLWTVHDLVSYLGRHLLQERDVVAYQHGVILHPELRLYQLKESHVVLHDVPRVVLRGGARHQRHPVGGEQVLRQAMQNGALEKAIQSCPTIDERLGRTILRAEARTTTSILNARSDLQVKHIMVAALKKAGLIAQARELEAQPAHQHQPQQQPQQPRPEQEDPREEHPAAHEEQQNTEAEHQQMHHQPDVQQLIDAVRVATERIRTMECAMQQMAILHHTQYVAAMRYDLTPLIHALNVEQKKWDKQVQDIHASIEAMNTRLRMWETTFLPTVMDRLAEIDPPPCTPTTPTSLRPMEVERTEEDQRTSTPTVPYTSEPSTSPIVDAARERSLQACCARVAQASRPALRPFARP